MDEPAHYEIQIAEQLDEGMSKWFGDLSFVNSECMGTILRGEMADQAALFGVLCRIRDFGLTLISVQRCQDNSVSSGTAAGRSQPGDKPDSKADSEGR